MNQNLAFEVELRTVSLNELSLLFEGHILLVFLVLLLLFLETLPLEQHGQIYPDPSNISLQ